MNLQAMRQRARDLSGIHQTSTVSDGSIDQLINEAYQELAGVENWPWLYGTETADVTASEPEVAIPSFRIIEGALLDGVRLHAVTLAEIDLSRIDREDTPYAYAVLGHDRLHLAPTPKAGGTLVLRGYRNVAPLADGVDEPAFDSEFHHVLPYAAAARLLIQEGDDSGRSGSYAQEVAGLVEGMRERYMRSHESSSFQWGGRRTSRPRWRLR